MSKIGVDVSTHNGIIDWANAKDEIDFAIIRAGYAHSFDARVTDNIKGCRENGIPYGLYWFSYALSVEDSIREADTLCDFADMCDASYPLCYDWEYDSDNYASKCGVKMSNTKREQFARAFLNRVEERGYYAMLYTNVDYLSKGFSNLVNRYDLWLAHWGVSQPSRSCGIWQKTSDGFVGGIGRCDLNIAYKDYPYIISAMKKNEHEQEKLEERELEKIKEQYWEKYMKIAKDVIDGKYGVNPVRKEKLKALGYDYDFVQAIVTALV